MGEIFKFKKTIKDKYIGLTPGNFVEVNYNIYRITRLSPDLDIYGKEISNPDRLEVRLFNIGYGIDIYINDGTLKLLGNEESAKNKKESI